MKIQILADDGEVMDKIENVHTQLKSQYGMGVLLDKFVDIYKNKYSLYMYEKYKRDRRDSHDRRHVDKKD
jgi:hypothetical protein